MIPIAILAGGMATRLQPVSDRLPKSLVLVAGEPFIAHQLRLLRREGLERVVLCVGHLGEMIREFVDDGARFGLQVSYSFDGDQLLGTGGALRQALPQLGETFFVLYGDTYLDIPFAPVLTAFHSSSTPALMTVFRNESRWDTSNVVLEGTLIVRYDKRRPTPDMHYIDYGLAVFARKALADRTVGIPFDLAELYSALAAAGRLAGYEVRRRFYEVGTPEGLAQTEAYLSKRES
jgi:NDP-sugar pyrophosphorylase family protein